MSLKLEEIEIKNLDHLGIVAGIIDEIGIVGKVRWAGNPIGDKLRRKRSCQAGLSGWLKKE